MRRYRSYLLLICFIALFSSCQKELTSVDIDGTYWSSTYQYSDTWYHVVNGKQVTEKAIRTGTKVLHFQNGTVTYSTLNVSKKGNYYTNGNKIIFSESFVYVDGEFTAESLIVNDSSGQPTIFKKE